MFSVALFHWHRQLYVTHCRILRCVLYTLNGSSTESEIRTELQHECLKIEEHSVIAPSALIEGLYRCGCQSTAGRRIERDSFCPGYGPVAGLCGCGNESLFSIKAWEFIDPRPPGHGGLWRAVLHEATQLCPPNFEATPSVIYWGTRHLVIETKFVLY